MQVTVGPPLCDLSHVSEGHSPVARSSRNMEKRDTKSHSYSPVSFPSLLLLGGWRLWHTAAAVGATRDADGAQWRRRRWLR
jgi:hypothetical protein